MKEQNRSRNIQNLYELAPMQAGMLFHSLLDKESHAYKEQYVFSLNGEINDTWLEKSFNILIERYDIFRTVFVYEKMDEPVQVVLKKRTAKMLFEDISHLSKEEKQKNIETFKKKDIETGFDLTRDLLMRIHLFKTGMSSYKLVWTFHHIIMDGWCTGNVLKEWLGIYKGLKYGAVGSPVLKPITQYKHYIKWLQQQDRMGGLRYWKEYLEGYERPAGLSGPGKTMNKQKRPYIEEEYEFTIHQELTADITCTAAAHQVTVNSVFQALWGILLQGYNNTDDAVFGAVVSGRPPQIQEIENMIGLFINTIPVRIRSGLHQQFSQVIVSTQENAAASRPYEYLPLAEIQASSLLKGRLINHILVFENYPVQEEIKKTGKRDMGFGIESVDIQAQTNYDFNIIISPGRCFRIKLLYNREVYDKDLTERTALHILHIARQVTKNPRVKIKNIEIITPGEKKQVLTVFNQPESGNPLGKFIHQLFAAQVEKTPDHVALLGKEEGWEGIRVEGKKEEVPPGGALDAIARMQLTYRELNKKSNQLAHYLYRAKGTQPDHRIGILLSKTLHQPISILGILKAGAAYVPIDTRLPEERIKYMIKDASIGIVISEKKYFKLANRLQKECDCFHGFLFVDRFDIHEEKQKKRKHQEGLALQPDFGSNSLELTLWSHGLAYLIYTSGTIGQPKGVMIEHGSLVNLCNWHNHCYQVSEYDHASLYAGFGFDASVWELFPYLITGASLYMVPDPIRLDIEKLDDYFKQHQITVSFLPTQFCQQFFSIKTNNSSLRILLTGGDKLHTFLNRDYALYNNYGPTENTVVTTSYLVEKYCDNIPIGKPIHNSKVYILNPRSLQIQPVGVPGELCIGGVGLARGYLNNPELTKEKFDQDIWDLHDYQEKRKKVPGKKFYMPPRSHRSYIYKSGDLARWLSDGNIECLGRIDQQVKIRGFRIELSEIENQLLDIKVIKQAVVIDRLHESGQKYLCAYFVSKRIIDPADLENQLLKWLPDYMVPTYFIQLEKIPLTSTGKIDRHSLPGPEPGTTPHIYTPPGNEIEEKLIEIWQEVLGGQKIGTTDNFFQVGGDSIKAIQVSARLKKYQLDLKINDLFLHPTIKELAKYVIPPHKIIAGEYNQGTITGEVPLTPIQQWFFENDFTPRHHYNNAVMLYKKEGFDQIVLKKLFTQIVLHHDTLRMVYRVEGDQILQWNRGTDAKKQGNLFDFEVFRMTYPDCFTIERESNRIQAGIDLTTGPLVKLGLFKTPQGDHLLIVIHHLVVDGISWRILFEDFRIGYQQLQQGEEIKFQEKTVSFRYWAQQLKKYSESKEILKELEYWERIEKTRIPPLPVDYQPGKKKKKYRDMESLGIDFDEKQTGKLLKEVHRPYNTNINDILLTALGMSIKEWSGNETVVINLEGHGREPIKDDRDIDTSRTIGWFTSQFPVLLNMNKAADLSTGIKLVKETLRRIPNKGIGYGVLRYLTPGNKKKGIRLRINPEISFNYLGQFHETNERSVFTFSPLHTGESVSLELETLYKIDINGLVKENMLTFSFNYSTCEYRKETIQQLAHSFKTNLVKIIEHCTGRHEKELTPSDLGDKELSLEELEDIKEMISL